MSIEKCILNDIGSIELGPKLTSDFMGRDELKVTAKMFQQLTDGLPFTLFGKQEQIGNIPFHKVS
jgi:hypothetical protein